MKRLHRKPLIQKINQKLDLVSNRLVPNFVIKLISGSVCISGRRSRQTGLTDARIAVCSALISISRLCAMFISLSASLYSGQVAMALSASLSELIKKWYYICLLLHIRKHKNRNPLLFALIRSCFRFSLGAENNSLVSWQDLLALPVSQFAEQF